MPLLAAPLVKPQVTVPLELPPFAWPLSPLSPPLDPPVPLELAEPAASAVPLDPVDMPVPLKLLPLELLAVPLELRLPPTPPSGPRSEEPMAAPPHASNSAKNHTAKDQMGRIGAPGES